MAEEIKVKITAEAAAAKLQLEQVTAALTSVEQELLKVAAASDSGKHAQDTLLQSFQAGRISAQEYHAELTKIAATQSRGLVTTETLQNVRSLRRDIDEAKHALRDFVSTGVSAGGISEAFGFISQSFGTMGVAVGALALAAGPIADLATESQMLETQSARLGLNFDQAAEAAGRFADETDALNVAQAMSQRGFRLTQTQLDALMRTAGVASHALGTDVTHAAERLMEALANGSHRALAPFGAALANTAGHTHTVSERLRVMTREAEHLAPAVQTSHDALESFNDTLGDTARAGARAFVDMISESEVFGGVIRGIRADLVSLQQSFQAITDAARQRQRDSTQAALNAARTEFIQRERTVAAGLDELGISREALPGTNVNRLTLEQVQEATGRLARLETMLRERGAVIGGVGPLPSGAPSAMPLEDIERAFRERRNLGGGRRATQREAREILRDLRRMMSGDVRENDRPPSAPTPPRDRTSGGRGNRDQWLETVQGMADRVAENRFSLENQAANEQDLSASELSAMRRESEARTGLSADEVLAAAGESEGKLNAERRMLEASAANHRSYTKELEELYTRQISASREAAEFTRASFAAVGDALVSHVVAFATGREELGDALKGMLHDTLESIGKEASVKAALNVAEGLGALATYRFDAAANHFAAAGVYTGVAVAAGLGAGALAPAAQQAGQSGGASRERSSSDRLLSERASPDATAAQNIVVNYWAPVVGGRQMLDADVGVRLDRYNEAASARQRRAA